MAWTVTAALDRDFEWTNAQRMSVFRLTCLSDGSASGDLTLSTLLETAYGADKANMLMRWALKGGMLYQVEYIPGSVTPTSNPTITVDNGGGVNIFDETFTAATRDVRPANDVKGVYIAVEDLIVASTTLANTKTAYIDLWILK